MPIGMLMGWTAFADDDGGMPVRARPPLPKAEADEDPALSLEITHTADLVRNASGGDARGTRYLDDLTVSLDVNLGSTRARASAIRQNGKSLSALIGDAQFASNIETGFKRVRLFEAWAETGLGSNASLRAGLLDVNSEFDVLEAGNHFVHTAFGLGSDFGLSGKAGPSVYPVTSLGGRLEVVPKAGWKLRAAVLDGVPGNPSRPSRTAIRFDKGDGALILGEAEVPVARGKLLIGHWRYTGRFATHAGGSARGSWGSYVRGEAVIAQSRRVEARQLAAFFRLGIARPATNRFSRFASAGLTLASAFENRPEDRFGLAVAHARTPRSYRLTNGGPRAETAFEASYRAALGKHVSVQPFAQYITNPANSARARNAFAFGLRSEISFNLSSRA